MSPRTRTKRQGAQALARVAARPARKKATGKQAGIHRKALCKKSAPCARCQSDLEFLQAKERPTPAQGEGRLRVVDLFAGCGGLSLGLGEAARRLGLRLDIRLAIDSDPAVTAIYAANFPGAVCKEGDVEDWFDGEAGSELTPREKATRKTVGDVDLLLGGPPCQGHSSLNNHTRGHDPKNALYLTMARAAKVLVPKVVVIENVAPVQRDETGVVDATREALEREGYAVAGRIVDLRRVGVPQRRRRYLLIASRIPAIDPTAALEHLATGLPDHRDRSVRWAIRDLVKIDSEKLYDTASRPSAENVRRMHYLFEKGRYDLPNGRRPVCHQDDTHTYLSMYGRLSWDKPAQTITTGFGSMGQGRYVHPSQRRTITPHEAARLQTFPDWFDFGETSSRGALAKMIGNAVPPLLMVALGLEIGPLLGAASERAAEKRSA